MHENKERVSQNAKLTDMKPCLLPHPCHLSHLTSQVPAAGIKEPCMRRPPSKASKNMIPLCANPFMLPYAQTPSTGFRVTPTKGNNLNDFLRKCRSRILVEPEFWSGMSRLIMYPYILQRLGALNLLKGLGFGGLVGQVY